MNKSLLKMFEVIITYIAIIAVIYYGWNYLAPELFHLSKITLFQAMVLNALSGCLFKDSVYLSYILKEIKKGNNKE